MLLDATWMRNQMFQLTSETVFALPQLPSRRGPEVCKTPTTLPKTMLVKIRPDLVGAIIHLDQAAIMIQEELRRQKDKSGTEVIEDVHFKEIESPKMQMNRKERDKLGEKMR